MKIAKAVERTLRESRSTAANAAPSPPPLRAKDLQLKYRGGTPALYLVETLGEWTGRRYERIPDAAVWQEWLTHLGLPLPSEPITQRNLEQMRELRAAVYQVMQAVRLEQRADAPAVACINHWAGQPTPAIALNDEASGVAPVSGVTHQQLLSLIARDAIELVTGPLRNRIRQCASATCPVLFVDRSRRGDRIWCSTTCGARLATARYRIRNGQYPERAGEDGDDSHRC